MIKVEWFYWLCGFLFLVTAVVRLRDREDNKRFGSCLLYTSPSPRDGLLSRMPSSA